MRRAAFLLFAVALSAQTQTRVVKSASGPAGREVSGKFVLDTVRSRFVYPQDRQLVVSFEWEGAPGRHQIAGVWRDPSGKAVQISDIVLDSPRPAFSAYWTFALTGDMTPGVWELQARVDGVPAGSHPFEVVMPPLAPPPAPVAAARMPLSPDQLFELRRSLVWIHKLDRQRRRTHQYSGWVSARGQVTTAFQAIDGCTAVAVEFADGSVVQVDRLLAWNRLQDWAVLPVETATNAAIPRAAQPQTKVGDDGILFDAEATARVLGSVAQIGFSNHAPFGKRILIQPRPRPASAGGPMLDRFGEVTGIIGGSQLPGVQPHERNVEIHGSIYDKLGLQPSVTPIGLVPATVSADAPRLLADLLADGTLTPPVEPQKVLSFAAAAARVSRKGSPALNEEQAAQFSRRDEAIYIFALLAEQERSGDTRIGVKIYDAANKVRAVVTPVKIKWPLSTRIPVRWSVAISPASLAPGAYRVDVLINDIVSSRIVILVTA